MIGVFDSGFGGLSILKEFLARLPQYDYLYLGDSARAPYGNRSPEVIYNWTREAADYLFKQGCEIIILACFTASANALRRLQQDLNTGTLKHANTKRILGVLIPLAEEAAKISKGHIGILGTRATINSGALTTELKKRPPLGSPPRHSVLGHPQTRRAGRADLEIYSQAAPLLVPLIEEGWQNRPETKRMVRYYLRPLKGKKIDTLLLACTHYPLLKRQIAETVGKQIKIIDTGKTVALSLADYLKRHPEIESKLKKSGQLRILTTDRPEEFERLGSKFLGQNLKAQKISLN